jgi:hypothetical protein
MNPVGFAVANVTGTVARLALIRVVGNVFGSPIRSTTGWLDQWKWYILAGSALVVGLSLLSDRRRGRSELGGLRHLGDDLSDGSSRAESSGDGSSDGSAASDGGSPADGSAAASDGSAASDGGSAADRGG